MLTLNACSCPRCHFYLGYSTTEPSFNNRRTTVIGSCLNCDYRLPIHAILRGRRPLPPSQEPSRSNLRLIQGNAASAKLVAARLRRRRTTHNPTGAPALDYGRDLRAVGQALEQLQLKSFHLKRDGRSYLIWNRDTAASSHNKKMLKSWPERKDPNYRLSRDDIDRIHRDGVRQRRTRYYPVDGHKLSHLLRTLGAQIQVRGQSLLGITWGEPTVSVVIETAHGRRHIEEIRTDTLYDLWVRMYLRRAH